MQSHLSSTAGTWDSSSGAFISEAHKTLATVLSDYSASRAGQLSLVWIPPKDRTAEDTKPWAILETSPRFGEQIIRYLSDAEMQDTRRVLQWVLEGDLEKQRPGDVLAKLQLAEQAERLLALRQEEEELADRLDLISFAAKTPLHTFRHNGQTYRN